METLPAPASSSPRVYSPIAHPNSPVPPHAVLQRVAYTDPSAPSLSPSADLAVARDSPSLSPASRLSGTAGDTHLPLPLPDLTESARAGFAVRSGAEEEGDVNSTTEENSPESSYARNPSPQGSSTGKFLCSDNPSPRSSCADSGTCNSVIKGFDNKKSVCVKPSLMKKTGFAGVTAGSMGMKKCGKVGSTGVTITVSHTEKETIVHTDSSNFREIVHQLTGASGNEDDLLPVTIPSRSRGSVDDSSGCLSKNDIVSRGPDLGPRRPAPTKLFERRRSSKTLERITTNCKDLPPLVPSPVTPLASDFERICFPLTPVASPAGGQQEHAYAQPQPVLALRQVGNGHLYSTNNHPGMYMHTDLTQARSIPDHAYFMRCAPNDGAYMSCSQQETSVEDYVIAEKGFFLHPQRPMTSEPALLPLFPESPRGK